VSRILKKKLLPPKLRESTAYRRAVTRSAAVSLSWWHVRIRAPSESVCVWLGVGPTTSGRLLLLPSPSSTYLPISSSPCLSSPHSLLYNHPLCLPPNYNRRSPPFSCPSPFCVYSPALLPTSPSATQQQQQNLPPPLIPTPTTIPIMQQHSYPSFVHPHTHAHASALSSGRKPAYTQTQKFKSTYPIYFSCGQPRLCDQIKQQQTNRTGPCFL